MKTQTAVGQFVVGKVNAAVVFKVVELNESVVVTALSEAMAGKTVGIQARTPVNKKAHIVEAEEIVADLNSKMSLLGGPTEMAKQYGSREQWANRSDVQSTEQKVHNTDRAARNANVGRFQSHAETVALQRFLDQEEYAVTVTGIEWFLGKDGELREDKFNRVGKMFVQIPAGYAIVRYYERAERQSYWYDFCDFKFDQFVSAKKQFNPLDGNGELVLGIKLDKNGDLYVKLPTSKNEENPMQPWPRLHTFNSRFPESKANGFNSVNLESALVAYLRYYDMAFVQANPANRQGIGEHCGACKYNMHVPSEDTSGNFNPKVSKDVEPMHYDFTVDADDASRYKNTLNTSDTIEMVQWGQEIPRRFCTVHKKLVDLEVVKEINEALSTESTVYYDVEGRLRYMGPNDVMIGGKAIDRYVALREGTADLCNGCAFYHNNQKKSDSQINKEKDAGTHLSDYWSDNPRADRMAIQTLINNGTNEEWITAYPGEVDSPLDFRVFGLGGVTVTGSVEVGDAAYEDGVLDFVPMTEQENVIETQAGKIINMMYKTAFTLGTLQEDTLETLFSLIKQKPEGISARTETRWDNAYQRLIDAIVEHQGE